MGGEYVASEALWLAHDLALMQRSNTNNARRKRLKLGCERLEVRRVLDASAMPIWDQMPDMSGL